MLGLCLPLLLLFETILSDKREQQGTRKNPGSVPCPEPAYPKLIKSSSRRLTSPCRANNFPPPFSQPNSFSFRIPRVVLASRQSNLGRDKLFVARRKCKFAGGRGRQFIRGLPRILCTGT